MKKVLLFFILVAITFMIAYCQNNQKQAKVGKFCKQFPNGHGYFCAQGTTAADSFLCPFLPRDIDVHTPDAYHSFDPECQFPFNWFSWQTFIALNWPANSDGTPIGTDINASPDAPRVWETYNDPDEIFGVKTKVLGDLPILGSVSKAGFHHFDSITVGHNTFFEAFASPLIDRNLNFTLYEIRVNPVEVKYIKDNGLNTYAGQSKFKGPVNFPSGSYPNSIGSMEIKVAWRILVPGVDNFERYFHRMAIIHVDKSGVIGGKSTINDTVTVGMVGMHIIRKVKNNGAFWIWSTFEHVDNAPDDSTSRKNYSFYNPDCTKCKLNSPPIDPTPRHPFKWSLSNGTNPQYARTYATDGMYGTQVYRVHPIESSASEATQQWQAKLTAEKSVWQYYKLIGSQWGVATETFPSQKLGVPLVQSNTVAETYFQATGSCFNCHLSSAYTSTSSGDTAILADFSFLLGIPAPPSTKK
ncbi:MAG: hypothetical protein ACKVT2_01650 [Saprospiraceae bacterium]